MIAKPNPQPCKCQAEFTTLWMPSRIRNPVIDKPNPQPCDWQAESVTLWLKSRIRYPVIGKPNPQPCECQAESATLWIPSRIPIKIKMPYPDPYLGYLRIHDPALLFHPSTQVLFSSKILYFSTQHQCHGTYIRWNCMTKESWSISYSRLLYILGQNFLDKH